MQTCDIAIRRMQIEDLDAVVTIENITFPKPWTRDSFSHDLTDNPAARWLVAEVQGQVVGFVGMWVIFDQSEVTNIAVHPEHRREGIGRLLLAAGLQYVANLGASSCTL